MGRAFDAVLFDWCGTLVDYPTKEDRFRRVLAALGRPCDRDAVAPLARAYRHAEATPEAQRADERCDLSPADHAATKLLIGRLAGFDDELAEAIERSYSDLATYPAYPESAEVIAALHKRGISIAIVSDFHIDIRPHLDALGVLGCIGGFALSCEVGVTKPHRRMFEAALEMIAAPPGRCLMVGDNPRPDGGAADLGIATLLLPLRRPPRPPLLRAVLALADARS